jgi:preprotein translocase subunit SecB
LDYLSANLDRSNYANAYAEDKKRITRSIESTYRVTDYSNEHFDVRATLSLRVDAVGFENSILALEIAVSGHFHPKKALSREETEEFAGAEARLIFWPYLRQIVSDTTGRMHIGTITLPLAVR